MKFVHYKVLGVRSTVLKRQLLNRVESQIDDNALSPEIQPKIKPRLRIIFEQLTSNQLILALLATQRNYTITVMPKGKKITEYESVAPLIHGQGKDHMLVTEASRGAAFLTEKSLQVFIGEEKVVREDPQISQTLIHEIGHLIQDVVLPNIILSQHPNLSELLGTEANRFGNAFAICITVYEKIKRIAQNLPPETREHCWVNPYAAIDNREFWGTMWTFFQVNPEKNLPNFIRKLPQKLRKHPKERKECQCHYRRLLRLLQWIRDGKN